MPRAPEDIDSGEDVTEWAHFSALGEGAERPPRRQEWPTSSGEASVVERKTDRGADISLHSGDRARVWK